MPKLVVVPISDRDASVSEPTESRHKPTMARLKTTIVRLSSGVLSSSSAANYARYDPANQQVTAVRQRAHKSVSELRATSITPVKKRFNDRSNKSANMLA